MPTTESGAPHTFQLRTMNTPAASTEIQKWNNPISPKPSVCASIWTV